MKVGFSTVAGTRGSASTSTNPSANIYRKLLLDDGRIVGAVVIGRAGHVQDLGVVQAMIRRQTDVSRWRQMLHSERLNYGMLAYEGIGR